VAGLSGKFLLLAARGGGACRRPAPCRPTITATLIVVAALGAAVSGTSEAGAKAILATPAVTTPIAVDGSDADWQGSPMTYLEDSVRVLAAAHDGDNLYLMFRFYGENRARRISTFGVTLGLDGGAGHATEYGVRYAGSAAVAEALRDGRDAGVDGFELPPDSAGSEEMPTPPRPGNIAVVRGGGSDLRPETREQGPAATSAVTDGLYCYEIRIPLTEIPGFTAGADAEGVTTVSLGIQLGGPTFAGRGRGPAGRDGSSGGMGGPGGGIGGPGGGMGGRGGMGGMGGRGGEMGAPGGMGGGRGQRPEVKPAEPIWVTLELTPSATAR